MPSIPTLLVPNHKGAASSAPTGLGDYFSATFEADG